MGKNKKGKGTDRKTKTLAKKHCLLKNYYLYKQSIQP